MFATALIGWLFGEVAAPAAEAVGQAWKVDRKKDSMTDETTVIARSGISSAGAHLRCTCTKDRRVYLILVLPSWSGEEYTLAEVRVDRKEPEAYTLTYLQHSLLVSGLGGAPKGANLVFYEKGAGRTLSGVSDPESIQIETRELLDQLRSAAQLSYRLSLAGAEQKAAEGRFALTGFGRALAEVEKSCPK